MFNTPSVFVAVPCAENIKAKTTLSLVTLALHTKRIADICILQGSIIQHTRNFMVKEALKRTCSHILFVDSDMVFNEFMLDNMLAAKKDILGLPVNQKKLPPVNNVRLLDETTRTMPSSLFECLSVGTGVMLINLSVFEKIEKPWFNVELREDGLIKTGEDTWFCERARRAGYEIWCDPTIPVRHCGEYLY